ncbi:YceI family protein [Lysobacter korlensis]|uniref:YceI family protein n=1 Tax=Lysobacter korlensis TaxID=553636 RepID=A0ABV6RHJ5_9GAMM
MAVIRSACAVLLGLGLLAGDALAAQADPVETAVSFQLRTRWGQRVAGTFPEREATVERLADGRHRVHVVLATGSVEILASPRYTQLARGPRFFDAERHPQITFVSTAFAPELLERGGPLGGTLTLHGVSREETFQVEPSACARPGHDCDVIAHGTVQRDDYGLDGLQMMLGNRVHFTLRVRHAKGS